MVRLNFLNRKHLPLILQTEKSECGLASIAMILNYYGHKIDINTLRNKYSISQHGATLKTIMQLADRVNLISRPLRLDVDQIVNLKKPAILHWDMTHFVILKEASKKRIVIHDPAFGIRVFTNKNIGQHFTGVALELEPAKSFVEKKEEKILRFRQIWASVTGLKRSLLQILFLSLLLQIFSLALPFYSQIFFDDVLISRDFDLLKILAGGFLFITIVSIITELVRSFAMLHLSSSLSFQFSSNIYRHLLHLPLKYFNKRHIGDLVSRFGSVNNIKDFLASGMIEIFIDGIMVIGTLLLMFIYSPTLTFVALIAVFLYVTLRIFTYNLIKNRNEEVITAGAIENTVFMENIRAIQGIKLFGKESERMSVWQNRYADLINSGINLQRVNIYIKTTHRFLLGTENIVLILIGGYAVLNNELSVGMIIAYLIYKDQFYARVFALLDKIFEFKLLDVHLTRLADIALSKVEEDALDTMPLIYTSSKILLELKDVSFQYSSNDPILFENINLVVEENESVAIVGPTGCGKSTLLKIILSLISPINGDIYFNGQPVIQIGMSSYRNSIAAVMQNDNLLTGSIFENITFFDQTPQKEEAQRAARLAGLESEIELMPMQYNTLVGNMGAALSGGQIQRLLLARAFYRNSKLLVLDEATSHLDIYTEELVNQSIKSLKIARVIVAHRPQTIKCADTIYELTKTGLVRREKSDFN